MHGVVSNYALCTSNTLINTIMRRNDFPALQQFFLLIFGELW